MPSPELTHLGTLTAHLGETFTIKGGAVGTRVIADVASVELRGERVTADMVGQAAADWVTVSPDRSFGTLDVRITMQTDDDAIIFVEYSGRIDFASGRVVSAPLFQTGDERYEWLNRVQALGVGQSSEGKVVYDLYEVASVD